MNYKKIYDNIINNRLQNPIKDEEYGEKHHIIPKCLGGSNKKSNLVKLTAREHFICHALLAEMYEEGSNEWHRMNLAFMMMKRTSKHNNKRYFNSRLYEYKRKNFSTAIRKLQSGDKNSQYGKVWIFNLELEQNKKIDKSLATDYLKKDWSLGRIINFEKFKQKERIKQKKLDVSLENKELKQKLESELSYKHTQENIIKNTHHQWNLFKNSEYTSIREFVNNSDYNYSVQNLSRLFNKHIDEYKSLKARIRIKKQL